jgi:hypothetical protein
VIYLIEFKLLESRRTPITNGYRPDWIAPNKPEHNCGSLRLSEGRGPVKPGETDVALLLPLKPELWLGIKIGEDVRAYEGPRCTGHAIVQGIYDLPVPTPAAVTDMRHGRCRACLKIHRFRMVPGVIHGPEEPTEREFHMPCPACGGLVEPVQ